MARGSSQTGGTNASCRFVDSLPNHIGLLPGEIDLVAALITDFCAGQTPEAADQLAGKAAFATSCEAHDWLARQGGRFDILRPPPRPPVPTVAELRS